MKKVFPDGLIFRIERNLKDLNGMPCKQQLTIDANFEKGFPKKNNSKSDINQTILITRRQLFETSLANITKEHHQVEFTVNDLIVIAMNYNLALNEIILVFRFVCHVGMHACNFVLQFPLGHLSNP